MQEFNLLHSVVHGWRLHGGYMVYHRIGVQGGLLASLAEREKSKRAK
jgi:hypothetical protein